MAIGPSRPSTGGSDPRLDALLTEMPTEEVFVKNSQNKMEGTGLMLNSMKIPNTVLGVDNNGSFKSLTVSPLAQQIVASNSEQMIRGILGIEIPTNISELNNDSGFITANQVPSTTQINSDWNSTSGVSQILNKPTLFDGKYNSLTNVPTTFNPTPHTHAIADVTGLQTALDGKINSGASIAYTQITGTPSIPAAQINSDWNATSGLAMILNKPTIPTVNYPVVSVNTKTGTVVLSASDVGAIAVGASIPYTTITGVPTLVTKTSQLTNDSGYLTSVSYPVVSVNGKTGTVVLSSTDVGAAATTHTHAITDVTGLQAAIDLKANATSLPNYRRADNTAVSGPVKVKYYPATSDATTSVWTVALGTDFTEVLDVQVTAVSIANTVAGVRQASLNAYTSTSTTLSGVTTGNTVLTTVLISAGANTLALIPSTSVRVTVTGK